MSQTGGTQKGKPGHPWRTGGCSWGRSARAWDEGREQDFQNREGGRWVQGLKNSQRGVMAEVSWGARALRAVTKASG